MQWNRTNCYLSKRKKTYKDNLNLLESFKKYAHDRNFIFSNMCVRFTEVCITQFLAKFCITTKFVSWYSLLKTKTWKQTYDCSKHTPLGQFSEISQFYLFKIGIHIIFHTYFQKQKIPEMKKSRQISIHSIILQIPNIKTRLK